MAYLYFYKFGKILLQLLSFIFKKKMHESDHPNLQYDQKIQPLHKLQVHNYHQKYQLSLVTSKKLASEGLVVRYDPQNQYAAIGCKNGDRVIYSIAQHKIVQKYNCANQNPVTTLKWRPMVNSTSKTLVTADSEGSLQYWHLPSLKKLFSMREQDNTINTIDFNRSGSVFATAGSDCNIRIYDQQTKSQSVFLGRASQKHPGHDNRIFAVKFVDQNTLISGGWDSNVHIWDLKQGKSVRCIHGPNISGESLDFQDGKILAGCYSAKDQIQVWDFNKGTKVECIDWTHNIDRTAYVYASSYSKYDIGMIGAGSTGAESSVRIYKDISNKGEHVLLSELKNVNDGCFSLDFSHKKSQMIFTTAHHGLYVYDIKRK